MKMAKADDKVSFETRSPDRRQHTTPAWLRLTRPKITTATIKANQSEVEYWAEKEGVVLGPTATTEELGMLIDGFSGAGIRYALKAGTEICGWHCWKETKDT